KAVKISAPINNSRFVSIVCSLSEKISKVNREPVALLWVERAGVPVNWKLHTGLYADGAIHAEYARAEKQLLRPAIRQFEALPLKRTRALTGELSKDSPVPTWVIGAP